MNKKLFRAVLCVGLVAIFAACMIRFVIPNGTSVKTITSSTLIEAIDIAELSTAEFIYRGIADVYMDEAKTNIKCHVCYNAVVKAGIDMKSVRFDVDNETKTVTAALPDIDLKVNIIEEETMAVIPSDVDIGIGEMLACSKEDAESEARESNELLSTARENLVSTIEGLLFPILKPQGYMLLWK